MHVRQKLLSSLTASATALAALGLSACGGGGGSLSGDSSCSDLLKASEQDQKTASRTTAMLRLIMSVVPILTARASAGPPP